MEQYNFVSEFTTGYIQIFKQYNEQINKYKTYVLVTGEKQMLRTVDHPNIILLETFSIPFSHIFPIFSHARNLILDVEIISGNMKVYGDHQLIIGNYNLPITINTVNIERTPIILKASRDFIISRGIPPFIN